MTCHAVIDKEAIPLSVLLDPWTILPPSLMESCSVVLHVIPTTNQ